MSFYVTLVFQDLIHHEEHDILVWKNGFYQIFEESEGVESQGSDRLTVLLVSLMLINVVSGFNFQKDISQNIRLGNIAVDFIVEAEGYVHQQNYFTLHELDVLNVLQSDIGYLLHHVIDEVRFVAEFLGGGIAVVSQEAQS